MANSYKYWTIDECRQEALKYTTKTEFRDNSSKVYRAALRNGCFSDITKHMIEIIKPDGYWTKEKCIEVAKQCHSRMELKRKFSHAYNTIVNNKWLDEICGNMKKPKVWNRFWTFKLCKKIASKYKYKKEFEIKNSGAYQAAKKYGWLDEITKHMIKLGSKTKRMIYSFEFPDNTVYVGLTYNALRRKNEHLNPRKYTKSSVYKHMKKTKLTPKFLHLTDYLSINDAIFYEEKFLKEYKNSGWIILNKIKTGGLGKVL